VRVIFHAHRPLKRIDVRKIVFACTPEIGAEQEIQMAFVSVSHGHPFYILDRREKGVPVKRQRHSEGRRCACARNVPRLSLL